MTRMVNTIVNTINNGITQIMQAIVNTVNQVEQPSLPVRPFIQSPLKVNQANVLDLMPKENCKYYQLATKSLFPDNEHFDVKLDKFQTFINLLFQYLKDLGMFGPNMNCIIPVGRAPLNMVSDYGQVSLHQVDTWVRKFIVGNSQNSKILFDLLMNTISIESLQQVQL